MNLINRYPLLYWLVLSALALSSFREARAASLIVSPSLGSAGAEINVEAQSVNSLTDYQLEFAGNPVVPISLVHSNDSGRISTQVILPALPAGEGLLRLRIVSPTAPIVIATTPFTALSPLEFSTTATTIHAGQSIPFSVTGLSGGSLSIVYEGASAFGPVAVASGAFSGKFIVPVDRPAQLPGSASFTVSNKIGSAQVNHLDGTLNILPRLSAPFQIGIVQPPPSAPHRGQYFNVTGQFTTFENEAAPQHVSLWYFGDDGEVVPLGAAQAELVNGQYGFSMDAVANGGLSMAASSNQHGAVGVRAPSSSSVGTPMVVGSSNFRVDQLPDDRWQIRVRVVRENGQPIAGALVQFDGAPVVADSSNGTAGFFGTIMEYTNTSMLLSQYTQSTDSRGCPLTLGRKLTDANGYAEFEFLDEDLALAQVPIIIANAGGQIQTIPTTRVRMAIDASQAGYGFQFAGGPNAGDFLPHIYSVNFQGAGDGDPDGDQIVFTDYYQDVVVQTSGRNSTFTLPLPPIVPMVGLYDTSIVPWIAKKGPLVIESGNEAFASNQLIFGPVFSKRGIDATWIDSSAEGFPTTIAVRTDPAVSGVVTEARLYLDANRNGTPEFISNFSANVSPVDCSIDGLDSSITWRANLPANLDQQADGRITGYLYFKGQPSSGEARQYIAIDMIEQNVSWLSAARYSEREVAFTLGGQGIGVYAMEDTADAQVQLATDPGYDIGRLKNSTDNTRPVGLFRNSNGGEINHAPLEGAHKEAGRGGSPTFVDTAKGVQFGPVTTTLIDQSFPLFYYVWGVPVLAGIEFGANFSLLAEIETRSKYTLTSQRKPVFEMKTTPSIDLGLNFYLDLDVLFDLVDGGVDLDAIFGLEMPITVDSGHPNGVISECFTADLIFSWHFEVFCLPLDFICDALNDIEGSKVLLSGNTGSGCAAAAPMSPLAGGPSTRPSARIVPMHTAVAYASTGAGFLAFTRDNSNGQAPPVLVVRPVNGGAFGRTDEEIILSTAPGIRSVDLVFHDRNRAVMVWAESDLDYAALAQLSPIQRIAHQRIMYSTYDGAVWAPKAVLSAPSGGQGGVDLAACTVDPACPGGGEVLAVWTRDIGRDITRHRTRVYTARFDPFNGWSSPTTVDATALLDSSPSAAYVEGQPVVAFVRSTNGVFGDTDARRIAYKFLTGSGNTVQVPASLPGGVAWPSIVGLDGGGFALAYTHADDARSFVGNTQRIEMANASDCAAGSCVVAAQVLTDSHGRPIYGEKPTAMVDGVGNVSVVMRGMGFGPGTDGSNVNASDPIGMAAHTGELISLQIGRQSGVSVPRPLSADGAGHFSPSAALDPVLHRVVAVSTRGLVIPPLLRDKYISGGATPATSRAVAVPAEPGIDAFSAAQGVDLSIESVIVTPPNLQAGATIRIDTVVRNLGDAYLAASPSYQMLLSWDAPRQAGGTSAGGRFIGSLASGEAATLSINVRVPAGFAPDQAHRLYASIFRNGNPVDDVQASNDIFFNDIGGMPVPTGLTAAAIEATTLVQLSWDPINDPQGLIAGYRIWCHDGNGNWRHLGSSFRAGFLDVAAPPTIERHYRVTTYSKNAIESMPSEEAVATTDAIDRIFADGFDP
jgi:hypothetical protein